MTEGFASIITQLERQRTAIERALLALREVDGPATGAQVEPASTPEAPIRKRRRLSAASRKKIALAQKVRWAKVKGEIAPPPATEKTPRPKRRISAEGMKRIIAATKKRWRLQRAAAKSALAAPKKVAGKKAAVKAPSTRALKKVAPVRKSAGKKRAPAPTTAPDQMQTVG